jgi:hypothetical protein
MEKDGIYVENPWVFHGVPKKSGEMYLEISWGSTSEFTGGLPMNNLVGNCSSALSVIRGNFL